MPSKKQKYNTRFPAGRIKKIMQTDEDVGRVAQAVPVIISKTLELFVHSLLTKTMQITAARKAKTLRPLHMKQCILSESRFDFLKDLVKGVSDESGLDDEVPTPPSTPAPTAVNSSPSVASLPPNLHSDGRTSGDCRISMDVGESLTASVNAIDDSIGFVSLPMSTSTAPRPQQIFLPTSLQQSQPQRNLNFVENVTPVFHVDKPNFYTEVDPMNLTTNSRRENNPENLFNEPTSNFTKTANIDEDYDT